MGLLQNGVLFMVMLAALPSGSVRSGPEHEAQRATVAVPGDVGAQGCGFAPLSLAGMRLYDYNARWTASNWNNAGSRIPWRFDHVVAVGSDAVLRLDASGAPQLQAVGATPARADGRWEVDVTMPRHLREGVVVAPLWLYDSGSKDEVDFEFVAARDLTVSLHSWPNGEHKTKTVTAITNVDFSGRRLCLGIDIRSAAGKVDMLINGQVIHRWDRHDLDFFVTKPMRPYLEMWAADPSNRGLSAWTGDFAGFAPGDAMMMTVHGYRYTPPSSSLGEPSAR